MARALAALLLLAALLVAGCGLEGKSAGFESESGRLRVATTTNFITDSVAEVGGERVEVVGLMGPGVDPHLYKASAADVDTLRDAELIFYGGLLLEAKLQEVLEEVGESRPAIAVTRDIPPERLLDAPSGAPAGEEYDPHVWFDVSLWISAERKAMIGNESLCTFTFFSKPALCTKMPTERVSRSLNRLQAMKPAVR